MRVPCSQAVRPEFSPPSLHRNSNDFPSELPIYVRRHMLSKQKLSSKGKIALVASAILLLVGSTIAVAAGQKQFKSYYEFSVYDPAEPVISTSVNHTFIDSKIQIVVNLSAHEGVKQIKGTYSIVIQIWNDTTNSYKPFQTLAANQPISLTTQTTTLSFTFTTSTPGTYNLDVDFTTLSVVTE
jgi:hypothetical protein